MAYLELVYDIWTDCAISVSANGRVFNYPRNPRDDILPGMRNVARANLRAQVYARKVVREVCAHKSLRARKFARAQLPARATLRACNFARAKLCARASYARAALRARKFARDGSRTALTGDSANKGAARSAAPRTPGRPRPPHPFSPGERFGCLLGGPGPPPLCSRRRANARQRKGGGCAHALCYIDSQSI